MKKTAFLGIIVITLLVRVSAYATSCTDINNHWAKIEIEEAIANNIINGYEDNTFRPDAEITLAEYLKIIINSAKFDLLKEGSYWPDYFINTAKREGLILENEYADYNKKLTRNEIARITARYIKVENIKNSKNKLKDIENEYKDEIEKLIKLKVINGYEDKTFRGENNVTRAEAIVIAKRAIEEKRKLVSTRQYKDNDKINFSNIKTDSVNELSYEIKNKKIYVYDYGKYSNLQSYEIKGENINIEKTIKIINSLIDEDSYTEVLYVPFKEIVNQFFVRCGENKNVLNSGGFDFEFTYYENKPYELKKMINKEIVTQNCYMKIEIGKLWRDAEKLNKKEYIDKYKKEKLRKCIEIEFGIRHSSKILEYMIEKYELKISGKTYGISEEEQKVFGNYKINYYKKEYGNPIFYISKNN